jgi:repressor LexA
MYSFTPKEKRFLDTYSFLAKTTGSIPSSSKLAKTLGYKSVNSARQFLKALEHKGINPISYAQAYSPALLPASTIAIPILGSAPCGMPLFAEENFEGEIPVDTSLLSGKSNKYFFLRANGTSMDLAGIDDGDFVLFRSQNTAEYGDRVVVLLGDEVTIKIFKPGDGYIALIPKSTDSSHKPIIVSNDIMIQGVVKFVVKKNLLEP